MSIYRVNNFQSVAGKAEELFSFLQSLRPYIEGSNGCLSYEILRNKSDENSFVVIERWQSETDHQQSIANFPKDEMQAAMTLFAGAPTGAYYTL